MSHWLFDNEGSEDQAPPGGRSRLKLVGILAMNDIVLHSDRKSDKEAAVPYDEVMTAFKGICDHHQLMTQQAALA